MKDLTDDFGGDNYQVVGFDEDEDDKCERFLVIPDESEATVELVFDTNYKDVKETLERLSFEAEGNRAERFDIAKMEFEKFMQHLTDPDNLPDLNIGD